MVALLPSLSLTAMRMRVWMVVRTRAKMAQRKKLAWHLRGLQPLLAIERLVTNEGWVGDPVKAASRRRRGPQARLYRVSHPVILGHRGRRLATATLLLPPSSRGFDGWPPRRCFFRHLRADSR